MKKALRIYMKTNAKPKAKRTLWQKLWAGNLASFLLEKAKKASIEQAILQSVSAGYVDKGNLSYFTGEFIPPDFPVVLELIDEEKDLISFFDSIKKELSDEKVYFIDLEEPQYRELNKGEIL